MINLRLPNINGKTDQEQIQQIKSFLHQLVQELNWVLSTMENSGKDTDGDSGK